MHIGILEYKEKPEFMGRHIATEGFLDAIKKYKGDNTISIFQPDIISQEEIDFIKQNPLDVLHYPGPSLYKSMEFKKINPKPMVTTAITHSLTGSPYMEWMILNLLAEPAETDVLFCTSTASLRAVNEMQKMIIERTRKIKILHTSLAKIGVETKYFYKKEKSEKEPVNLLYFGRFCPYTKVNLVPLIRMLGLINFYSKKDFTITFAGADNINYISYLKKEVQDASIEIKFETNVSEKRKTEIYSEADIFLAPSNNAQETFGITLVEALASGLPIVGYDWSGYRDIVKEGYNGFLSKTKLSKNVIIRPFKLDYLNQNEFSNCVTVHEGSFVANVLRLIRNRNLLKTMSENAFKSSKRYDWELVIQDFLNSWQNLSKVCLKKKISKLQSMDYYKIFSHYASED